MKVVKFNHITNFFCSLFILMLVACSEPPVENINDKSELAQHKVIIDGKELDFGDQILYLIIVLELYRSHVGTYPSNDVGLNALITAPEIDNATGKWNGPYADTDQLFVDPWGNPLYYAVEDGVINLRSLGPDGLISKDDMIASEMYPDVFREMKKLAEVGVIQTGEVKPTPYPNEQ